MTGHTVFNMIKLGEVEVDAEDRPLYPPKIKSTEVCVHTGIFIDTFYPGLFYHKSKRSLLYFILGREKENRACNFLKLPVRYSI